MWSRGRHFRIASRDVGKSTSDSYISAYFDVGHLEKREFIGQIHEIIKLNYDSVKPILIKAKWYPNKLTSGGESTTLLQDECGIQRVLAKDFIPDHLLQHEPFVFPEHCNQVFLVPDPIHRHWKLVVDTEVRRHRANLPRQVEEVTISGDGTSGGGDEGILEGPSVGSDSEGEPERDEEPDTAEDMYPEEILTYKRRPRQSMVVEDHTLEASAVDEVISEDENAPEMGDFAVIEP
jgi:hypothetical protein